MRIPKKIRFVPLSLFITLLLTELVLIFFGFGYEVRYSHYLKHDLKKDNGSEVKIFCLGESTTWGVGCYSDSLSFNLRGNLKNNYPNQLKRLLEKKFPQKSFSVFFDVTIGQNSSEILRKFPKYIEKYSPDLVIAMVGTNNLWNLKESNIFLLNKDPAVSLVAFRILSFLDHFKTWKLFKLLIFRLVIKDKWDSWDYYFPADVNKKEEYERKLNYFNKRAASYSGFFDQLLLHDLSEIVKIAKANNIKIIISGYPLGALREIHMEVANKFKIPFVNNYYLDFKKLEESNQLSNYLISDNWHPNAKGYGIMADNIFGTIVKERIFE